MRIKEAFELYRKYEIKAMGYSVNTDRSYENVEKSVVRTIGNVSMRSLSLDAVHEFYLKLLKDHSKDTARSYISKLRVIVRYCRKRGIKTLNPDEIRTPRSEKRVARFITYEEYEKLLKEAKRSRRGYSSMNLLRNELILEILYNTGLRVGELCALNRNSIHNRQFTVVGKSKEPRPCYITKSIESKLARYLELRKDTSEALLVSNQTGMRITAHNVEQIFRNLSKSTGVVATPHTLRHSFATRLIEDGVDIRYVASFLGHESLQTTQKYTHVRNHVLYEIYESVINTCN